MCNCTRAKVCFKEKKREQKQNKKKNYLSNAGQGVSLKNQPTMIIRLEAKWHSHQWPPHQGNGPTGSLHKQTLEQGVSLRASLPTFRASLVNGIMVIWLPSQHDGLHFDKNCSSKIHKGSWFRGEINNSAKVMNTCRQQSSVNGIGVIIFTPIRIILKYFFLSS